MKYRVGKKQKRVILDEKGYEVAICHKGNEEVAQQICDLLNKHGLVSEKESLHLSSFPLPTGVKVIEDGEEKTITKNTETFGGKFAYRLNENVDALYLFEDFERVVNNDMTTEEQAMKIIKK